MAKLVFRFTGLVTPDQLRKAARPTEPIPYRMDTALFEAIHLSLGKTRTAVAQFMEEAVSGNIEDLDAVLMAAMDIKERQVTRSSKSSAVQISIDVADVLKDAAAFLKEKNYTRMGRGTVMTACAILEAEKRRFIGSADQPDKPIVSTLYNDDPGDAPVRLTPKVKSKPGPKPGAKAKLALKGKPGPKPKLKGKPGPKAKAMLKIKPGPKAKAARRA